MALEATPLKAPHAILLRRAISFNYLAEMVSCVDGFVQPPKLAL